MWLLLHVGELLDREMRHHVAVSGCGVNDIERTLVEATAWSRSI